jgi:hypothetical protein
MGLMANINRTISAVGSVGGVIGDTVEVFSASLTEGKNRIVDEISSSNEEARIENAMNIILAKAEAIKQIMAKLNISAEEASKLLENQLQHP